MNDKHDEPPQVADGYGVSVAYACLVDAVRAIQIEVRPDILQPVSTAILSSDNDDGRSRRHLSSSVDHKTSMIEDNNVDNVDNEQPQSSGTKRSPLHEQIINSSWSGLLSAFCPLIESWYVSSSHV